LEIFNKAREESTNFSSEVKFLIMVNAQNWLDNNYPLAARYLVPTLISVGTKGPHSHFQQGFNVAGDTYRVAFPPLFRLVLTGSLELNNFFNLVYLDLSGNKLTILNFVNCPNLRIVKCCYNKLTNLAGFSNLVNCEKLDLSNNPLADS
jgi:Leucine-rich repeat (LRR) protein